MICTLPLYHRPYPIMNGFSAYIVLPLLAEVLFYTLLHLASFYPIHSHRAIEFHPKPVFISDNRLKKPAFHSTKGGEQGFRIFRFRTKPFTAWLSEYERQILKFVFIFYLFFSHIYQKTNHRAQRK